MLWRSRLAPSVKIPIRSSVPLSLIVKVSAGLHRRGLISATRRNFPAARDRAKAIGLAPTTDDPRGRS